ncbi:conserved Plasmodium protein, unknown function [Plasmodium chabaudi adami]|uniref:Uncharacterized protein n=1 Tax=Plasmodium chabaudi adami TaxID=5826 RepID=A0A1C6YPX3_PLACE|nr:conserved Plasmodium protein, unknown function [Plasmodium chabaudi adami]
MINSKYENLKKYDLNLLKNEIFKKENKEKNDLKNILFFPSLFWYNGNFCPPMPLIKYDENNYNVEDYIICSIHKHSVIIKKILKNEIIKVSMFNDEKVLSCLFYINISYILRLINAYTRFFSISSLLNEGRKSKSDEKCEHEEGIERKNQNMTYLLYLYNEKNEIHLFDMDKKYSILKIHEDKKINCFNFNYIYINKKNSLYNKMLNDIYENNIKTIDLNFVDDKLVMKNKYCFELAQEKCAHHLTHINSDCNNSNGLKFFKKLFYVLIYGDNEGNIYFFLPEKKIKLKKNIRKEIMDINFLETNVKEYFNVKNKYDLFNLIKNNYYIFIGYKDCIYILNFYIYEIYFIIDLIKEDKIYSFSSKFNKDFENYISFSTKKYIKIFNVNKKEELDNVSISPGDIKSTKNNNTLDVDNVEINKLEDDNSLNILKIEKDKKVKTGPNTNKEEKELKHHICISFDSKNNLYISNDIGIIYVYNLKEKKVVKSLNIFCKRIFYLFQFVLDGKEYIYIYDSEKFYFLYDTDNNKIIYKKFTISAWIYNILCFNNNIFFSLGNENIYNLQTTNYEDIFIKNIYYENINICIYLVNHPFLSIISFINKKSQFGFFFFHNDDKKKKKICIPSINENKNVLSICWFQKKRHTLSLPLIIENNKLSNNLSFDKNKQLENDEECLSNYLPHDEDNAVHKVCNNLITDSIQNSEEITQGSKKKRKKKNNPEMNNYDNYDNHIVVLTDNSLYLYNILNRQIKQLNNHLLNNLFAFKERKKYIASTILNSMCYVFILYDKNLLIFDENFIFTSYIIKINEKINKMYIRNNIIFIHSNSNVYFSYVHVIINKCSIESNKTSNTQNGANYDNNNKDILENKELYFIKLKLTNSFKIILFDFYNIGDYIYVAIFSKKKTIFVYKIDMKNIYMNDNTHENNINNKHSEIICKENDIMLEQNSQIEGELIAQFFNFYIFDHINKIGSIISMKFFYNSIKQKIYLVFGGLEQFLFLWNFLKYPLVRKQPKD